MKAMSKAAAFEFKPFSVKQKQLMFWWMPGSPHRDCDMVIADGSIRSGKTVAMICGFMQWSMKCFSGQNFILSGKTIGALKRNVIAPLRAILGAWALPYHYVSSGDEARIEAGGNTYYLYDANNERSQDRLQGLTAAGALGDEVALFPRSFVEQMIARCSVEGARIWLNCNPANPAHFVKADLIDNAKTKHIYYLHFTMKDNLALSPKTVAMYMRMYVGVFYRRFVLGEWVPAEGLIYPMFSTEQNVTAKLPQKGSYYISVDYGTLNPFSAGLWCVSDGIAYRIAEYYHDGRATRCQMTDDEYYQALEKLAGKLPVEAVVVDPSAASFITLIRKKGRFPVRKAKNDVLDGIRLTARLLASGWLKFSPACEDAIREFGAYVWDENNKSGEDKPLKENDHAMDDIRYFCMTILRPLDRGGALGARQ